MTSSDTVIPTIDVAVFGAGAAGVVAAVQAARAGASCVLVEKTGLLGGTAVTAGVNFPGLFHAWGKQIIAGIGWEMVVRTVNESGGQLPDFRHDERRHSARQVWVDRFTYAAINDAMIREAGVACWLHSMPVRAFQEAGMWRVDIACKEGVRTLRARVVIDATGDANLASIAGLATRRNATLQPGTLVFRASGYDPDQLDYDALTLAAANAIAAGGLDACDLGGLAARVCSLLRNHGENIIHVTGIDARTSAGKTEAEFKGRAALLRLQRFFRKQPGLADFNVVYFAPECGIRETVTIDGEVEIKTADYVSGVLWDDAVCYSFYPIDVHATDGHGIDIRPLQPGIFPTMPLRSLLPKGSRNFLAAGRIACGDKEAHSAFRVQASCMATGQAAGAVAALACQSDSEIRQVPLDKIHALLKSHGAIVPQIDRLG